MTPLSKLDTRPRTTLWLSLVVSAALTIAGCKPHDQPEKHAHEHDAPDTHTPDEGHRHPTDPAAHDSHADEVTLSAEAIRANGITIANAEARPLRSTFVVPGQVAFDEDRTAHVGSPLRGRAAEVRVTLGQAVRRGDPLLVIESPELGQAQADFFARRVASEASRPVVKLAKLSWERAAALLEQSQGIPLAEVQKREAEYQAALASQHAADAAAIGAENTLHLLGMSQDEIQALARSGEISPRFTITAPIDGAVIQREITLGELVSPDRQALVVLADVSTLWVLADVPESRVSEVSAGTKAWISVGPSARAGESGIEGQVTHLGAIVDPTTRTLQARIVVSSSTLRPGMFATIELESSRPDHSGPIIALPDEAIQLVEGEDSVFVPVKGEENTFARRKVTLGRPARGLVPILSGLAEGEPVVVAGSFMLKAELGKAGAEHSH